ncbi:terminase large subunit [Nocardioides sp. STR2]|uniref:Terminase large subunit n=1 Tax=Nocardioides pini TaxID=2975053 RepID=A0ABT4CCM8_9ACTN|nr:terminase TerL endonuclease subunit [Nocardioides pini]MCY4726709.1 terminase large subunit [Nocardioides pini]
MTTTRRTPSTDRRSGNPAKRAAAKKPDPIKDLKLSPEVHAYMVDRGIPLPDCPPHTKTPEPRDVPGAAFDFERVDKVLAAFKALTHVSGRWAGQPLTPDPWQVAYILAPTFGWVRWDDEADAYVRIIRDLYVDVPRKNGKSTISSGIALYMACADGEQGAQVVTAATGKEQAKFVFSPIKTLAEKAPALKGRVKAYAEKVIHLRSASTIIPVSSVADAQHGANIHCSVVDELHVHKNPDLVETIETGRGSRTQPLSVIITTADSGKPGTIYDRKRRYVDSLAAGTIRDEHVYGVVWAANKDDDPFAVETQKKANPGYGISPSAAYLAAEAKKAKNDPSALAAYQRLHLGIRTKQAARFVNLDTWRANAGDDNAWLDTDALRNRRAYGGLDLASTSDLTALCWLLPRDDDGFDALWRMWVPEAALDDLNTRTAGEAMVWLGRGWLRTTPGNVTDYAYVRASMNEDADLLDVQTVAFDRWNASQLTIDLTDDGFEMVKLGQGFASMSAPLKEVKRLLLTGQASGVPMIRHGGNDVMTWMTDNLAVAYDAAGNVKPDKASAADKIDGWSALVNAMSEAMAGNAPKTSAYDDGGLRVV